MDIERFTHGPFWARYGDEILHGLLNVAWAAIILIAGLWIASFASRLVKRAASRAKHIEPTLVIFFGSIVRYAIIAIVIVAVLQRFGVQTTSIVAVLGAATLAIGLALQGALSNVAAGVLLILYRPYRIGDYVDVANGKKGIVKDLNIFTTELSTLENVKVVVPNGQIFSAAILNFSASNTRRISVEFHVGYGADIPRVVTIVDAVMKAETLVLDIPPAQTFVIRHGDVAVSMQAEAWCATQDFARVRQELLTRIHAALTAANIPLK